MTFGQIAEIPRVWRAQRKSEGRMSAVEVTNVTSRD
jgi:hypothetical protein